MKVLFFAVLCGVLMWAAASSPPYSQVCPPQNDHGYFCDEPCSTDTDCGYNRFCCQVDCGKTCMERVQPNQSYRCPGATPGLNCFIFLHQCNNDQQCRGYGRQQFCCLEPACGRTCKEGTY